MVITIAIYKAYNVAAIASMYTGVLFLVINSIRLGRTSSSS